LDELKKYKLVMLLLSDIETDLHNIKEAIVKFVLSGVKTSLPKKAKAAKL
jgi:hypothetical protein